MSSTGAKAARQDLSAQTDALKAAGVDRVWEERASGARSDRPVMLELLATAELGDQIVVVRLDRFGRSLLDLLSTLQGLEERSVGFRSLTESIDTSTAAGKLALAVLAAAAEYERTLLRERILASRAASGRVGGRPKALTVANVRLVRRMIEEEGLSVPETARQFGVSNATIYRALRVPEAV